MFKIEIDIDLKFQNLITMHGISDDLEPKVKLHIFEKKVYKRSAKVELVYSLCYQ